MPHRARSSSGAGARLAAIVAPVSAAAPRRRRAALAAGLAGLARRSPSCDWHASCRLQPQAQRVPPPPRAQRGPAALTPRLQLGRERSARKVHTLSSRRAVFTDFVSEVALDPRIFLGEVSVVLVLSSLFETWESWVRRQISDSREETAGEILNVLFKEITGLGFIGLLLFLVTRSGVCNSLAGVVLGRSFDGVGENPLAETFEDVHIMIFMLMVVLLFQAAAAFIVSRQVSDIWESYSSTRAFGVSEKTLESLVIKAGYLDRVPNPDASRGVDLEIRRPFAYGGNLFERLKLRRDPLHKLIMWRAIRHEFLFPGATYARGEEAVRKEPDMAIFSFEAYLRRRLGKIVLALVEVNISTWILSLVFFVPLVYLCRQLPLVGVTAVQCAFAWLLVAAGALLAVVLEEDTYELTPQVPADLRQTLRLFSGTSSQMLRRLAQLSPGSGRVAYNLGSSTASETTERSVMGRRFRPGLGDADVENRPRMIRPPEFKARQRGEAGGYPSSKTYVQLLQILIFTQAICITSLIVSVLSEPLVNWDEIALYLLAWAEWPVFLFFVTPVLVRRLTVRSSIEQEKDVDLMRQVSLEAKENLLRDFVRLVKVASLERRAALKGEPWALDSGEGWTRSDAANAYVNGLSKFQSLPRRDRWETWHIFAALDADNDGLVVPEELAETLCVMGRSNFPLRSTRNLMRLVEHDGQPHLTLNKFEAITALALDTPLQDTREDLEVFYALLDQDGDGQVTVFEVAAGLQRMRIGMSSDDVANLFFTYFGRVQPTIEKEEFVEWIQCAGALKVA